MSEKFPRLTPKHIEFIERQHMFFVGSAGAEGYVNVSPKGMDSLRVLSPEQVVWLNLTGSGNESAAHVLENQRMTIMFCSFERQPLILRLYGAAKVLHPRDDEFAGFAEHFPSYTGTRQIFVVDLTLVQTSCGYAVPHFDFRSERETLTKWAQQRGRDGIEAYWHEKNRLSLDQRPTGIEEPA